MGEQLRKLSIDFEKKRLQLESTNAQILRINIEDLTWEFITPPPGVERPEVKIQVEEKPQEPEKTVDESKKTWTLTGRVKGNVREGRPDGAGKPTAWARVAAHNEEKDEAWMLSTTFHRASTRAALGLKPEDQITFEGYLRPSNDASKMDSFSVFHLIDYPGKPAKES